MHLGFDLLAQSSRASWPSDVDAVAEAYMAAAEAAAADQGLEPISGAVVGVTDVVDVAEALGLLDAPPIPVAAFREALEACVRGCKERGARAALSRGEVQNLARVLALRAVAATLLALDATLSIPSAGRLSWTLGFFLGQN